VDQLNENERRFLAKYGLSGSDVHYAPWSSGLTGGREAKELGKTLVLGGPCRKARHRLRTRAGHCVQCNTSKIAYQARYSKTGYVYVAGSLAKQLMKVGCTESISGREKTLREQTYAGAGDWKILFAVFVEEHGRIEGNTSSDLKRYSTTETYWKDGNRQTAREVFRCSLSVARNALEESVQSVSVLDEVELHAPTHAEYEFS